MKRLIKNPSRAKISAESKAGFTIIEVTLVTAFMAMLMIAIAVITTSIAALYQKGITLKTVNSVGRNLITELTTSINSAPSIDSTSLCNTLLQGDDNINECINDNAYNYIYRSWEDEAENPDTHLNESVQYGGIMCTGNYSYVWNTHYGIESGNTLRILYTDSNNNENMLMSTDENPLKLVRFRDRTYRACSNMIQRNNYNALTDEYNNSHTIDIRFLANGLRNITADFQENFLEASDLSLSLYEFTIFPVSQDSVTLRSFFSGTFILATERGGVNIIRTGDYCKVGEDLTNTEAPDGNATDIFSLGSEFNYCGINKFNFAARTAGSGV